MEYITDKTFTITQNGFDCHLSTFKIHGDVIQDYPSVVDGYALHFTYGKPLVQQDFINKALIEYDWKYSIMGELDDLKSKLEKFKNELIDIKEKFIDDIDQFAHIYLFIVPKFVIPESEEYKLVLASDSFDLSQWVFGLCG